MEQSLPYSFTCINAGVDWITASAASEGSRSTFEDIWRGTSRKETAAGVEIRPAAVRDYSGWRLPGMFYGERHDDSLIVLSGARAPALWRTVAQASTNVSRLDLQATVWTHGEQPALSRWYYQRVRRLPPKRGRPRSFSLIQSHPAGDTLYVGKRQSDCYGRCYDYAAAHRQGEPRTLWRYEVEFKRHLARHHSASLLALDNDRVASESAVASWYKVRGIQPSWSVNEFPLSEVPITKEVERDVLSWFDTSVSKTVASAVRRFGLATVLRALHLSEFVIPRAEKEDSTYASDTTPAVAVRDSRRVARSVDSNSLPRDKPDKLNRKHGRS
jgi:hypothetical protein